ncbi:hypothetical protein HDV01_000853 [Terramyces sp. JEL0728]|nr:hypothetical protein HDV01_000853 [Terramyces sp. JEL0728]
MPEPEEINEWDLMANKYNKVFRPRFVPVYNEIANLVAKYQCSTVLDFATGPGEPALTILNTTTVGKVIACDGSAGMLSYLQRAPIPAGKQLQVKCLARDKDIENMHADAVTCSFGIMYNENLSNLFKLFQSCAPIFVGSVWPHHSTVPFLRIVKDAPSGGLTDQYFETEDASFSFWKREKLEQILSESGYSIIEYNTVEMPMEFATVEDLMEFQDGPGFVGEAKEAALARAAKLMEPYLQDGIYKMDNQGVVFVAKKN